MSTADSHSHAVPGRGGAGLLKWLAVACLLLAALGYFVVKPVAERVVEGVVSILGSMFQGLGAAVQATYEQACFRIEQGPEARALFGEPVLCAPLEDVQFLAAHTADRLEFQVELSGPRGAGLAHVTAEAGSSSLRVTRIELTTPDGDVELLCP